MLDWSYTANSGSLDYRMSTGLNLTTIDSHIGEVPIAPPLGAILNAIHDALGVRLTTHPMKPARILEALAAANGSVTAAAAG